MPFNSLDFFLHALLVSAAAVCFAVVLVADGMLLLPVQRWLREWHKRAWANDYAKDLFDAGPPPEKGVKTFQRRLDCLLSAKTAYHELGQELDSKWWWKPLWGCVYCVAGQWGFWFYLVHSLHFWPHFDASAYVLRDHLYFTSLTLMLASLWRGLYAWSQKQ